jgi:hypothetical protein
MAFTLTDWKAQLADCLQRWRVQLAYAKPEAVYTTLAALALWPLLQVAQSEGILPVAIALGQVLVGIGSQRIAEQVQRWHDQEAPPSAEAIETWVKGQLADNAEVCATLHAIVETVEATAQARAGLNEADRQWFVDTLRRVQVKAAVEQFAALFPRVVLLVTSRIYAYQRQDWKLRGFYEAVLQPFDDAQVDHFIRH